MKHACAVLLLVCAAAPVMGQAPADKAALDKTLIANERALIDAVVKKDMKAFKALTLPEAIAVAGTGPVTGPLLESILTQQQIQSSTLDNLQVHWFNPDTAVITSRWTGTGTFLGMPIPSPTIASTLWIKRGGKWLAAFHQESTAAAMPAAAPKK